MTIHVCVGRNHFYILVLILSPLTDPLTLKALGHWESNQEPQHYLSFCQVLVDIRHELWQCHCPVNVLLALYIRRNCIMLLNEKMSVRMYYKLVMVGNLRVVQHTRCGQWASELAHILLLNTKHQMHYDSITGFCLLICAKRRFTLDSIGAFSLLMSPSPKVFGLCRFICACHPIRCCFRAELISNKYPQWVLYMNAIKVWP